MFQITSSFLVQKCPHRKQNSKGSSFFIHSFNSFMKLKLTSHACNTLPLAVGSEDADTLDPKASDDAKALMMWVKSVLAKYWILLCCGAFLLVGLQNEVSVYQIGYMAIFLFILICYQVMFCRLVLASLPFLSFCI